MKHNNKILSAIVLSLALATTACTTSITPINTTFATQNNIAHVKQAIINAAYNRGWNLVDNKDNSFTATLNVRSHEVVVKIPYSTQGYQINYVSSVNMKAANGKIHTKYNNWVNNLRHDIDLEIAKTL